MRPSASPPPPLRVLFVGAYGIENAGDDAALAVMVAALRERVGERPLEVAAITRHPDALLTETLGVRCVAGLEYGSREEAAGRWFRGLNPDDDSEPLDRVAAEIRKADVVVAGAGNVLIDLTLDRFRGPIALLGTYAFLADLHRTPLFLYGIGAGPLNTELGRSLSGWIARRSAVVTCRDTRSAQLVDEVAGDRLALVLPDPVLALAPASDAELAELWRSEGVPARGARPRLALALRDLACLGGAEHARGERHHAALLGALADLARDFELLFVPQSTYRDADDRLVAERLIAELPEFAGGVRATYHVLRHRHPAAVLRRVYESAQVTLAVRLHGAVFSALSGVPVVALAYLPKVRAFMQDAGLADDVLEPGEVDAPELAASVRRAAERDERRREDLRARCRQLAAWVGKYADQVMELASRETEQDGEQPLPGDLFQMEAFR